MTITPEQARTPFGAAQRGTLEIVAIEMMPVIRQGLQVMAASVPGVRLLGCAGAVGPALLVFRRTRPQIVLVDSALDPQATVIGDLIARYSDLTVVAWVDNAQRTSGYVAAARAVGAHGVIPKTASAETLFGGIRQAHVSRRFVDAGLAEALNLSPGARSGSNLLSGRQREVLALIAHGLSSQEMAEELFVSPETVRTHTKEILHRLKARHRAHAVARAFDLGLLTTDRTRSSPDRRGGPRADRTLT